MRDKEVFVILFIMIFIHIHSNESSRALMIVGKILDARLLYGHGSTRKCPKYPKAKYVVYRQI